MQTPIAFNTAVQNLDATGAAVQEWDKLKSQPAWDIKKVKPKSEVVRQVTNGGRLVRFASLMDLCHVKRSELAKHLEQYKGRDVLRVGQRQRRQWTQGRSTQITAIPETKASTRVDETRTRLKTQWFPFERNLYIHPLAGFLWERESSKKYISSTTGKVRRGNVCQLLF